ncbi:hypothetical protein BJQ89_00729 [Arthrobacter sp. ES1]|nr:hypothetical protein [Arthrobacter sp. ES1]
MEVVRHGHTPAEKFQCPGLFRVKHVVAVADHPVAGDEQERCKEVQHPFGTGDDYRARGDENATEDQRAEDPEEQDPVLVFAGYREVREDNCPDEHVIDGEGFLDQVAGEVLLAKLLAVNLPDQGAETNPDNNPDRGP